MAVGFHGRAGSLVTLSNTNRTAQRNHPAQEFNNGVVVSSEALKDNQLFEVKIDRKVNAWSGSIEIGVTSSDPTNLNFPTSATGFREGTWVMSGCSVMKDGHTTIDEYGQDLDQLSEGDRVGVLRTSTGGLHFYVNGIDQGQAATGVPPRVYAVVDMYGKCAQVSIVDDSNRDTVISNEFTNEAIAEAAIMASNERLVFHEKCGTLVKLTNNRRTAERRRPLDEFNNGVVMTNRPIKDEEMFEIRLDRLVDKWSGSIEVGITTHNPSQLDFPATMTNMRSADSWSDTMLESTATASSHDVPSSTSTNVNQSQPPCPQSPTAVPDNNSTDSSPNTIHLRGGKPVGCTIMMSGCGILTNGKGTRREYGEYNLDELQEGDRIGLMRKSTGALHYYINGIDQGVAATRTPAVVWGVVDLYGMAVKVTILDRSDPNYPSLDGDPQTLGNRVNYYLRQFRDVYNDEIQAEGTGLDDNHHQEAAEKLLFHPHCGAHAAVLNGQRTAHRPNAMDDFNNGVVLTSRILAPNEMFEVRLDRMVDKWAGSIEIGLTSHSPSDFDFPSTMTNIRSGTWMMTGNGVMHNGTTVIDEYGQNLDRLKVGDRVGVLRREDGTLHFYVNGTDQGEAATNVPGDVYGVIDLYGQAAQATIIDQSDPTNVPEVESIGGSQDPNELLFSALHGKNAIITNNGRSSSRPNARGEFNDAIVMSNRPLRDNELFEVTIDKMVDRWSGSIEAGVTLIQPEDLDFPNTMTDIDYDAWMLSGSAIMQDGSTIRNGYRLDLDSLGVGSRMGMMRCSDGTLHYYHDGVDQGVACTDIPTGVFAVIDLYGQCAQVTITSGSGLRPPDNHLTVVDIDQSLSSPMSAETTHRFSQCCGKNVAMKNNGCTAVRVRNFNHGLAFSADPLRPDELFEVKLDQMSSQWSGSLQIGLTTMAISDSTPLSLLPPSATSIKSKVTWLMTGSDIQKNEVVVKENYAPSLDRLQVGDRVGVKRAADATMHIYINGEDMGVAASNLPKNVFALIDIYGTVDTVTITSSAFSDMFNSSRPPSIPSSDSSQSAEDEQDQDTAEACYLELYGNHGKNIQLSQRNLRASRVASYNQGMVISHKPLPRNHLFKVRVDRLNQRWTSSLVVGVVGFSPERVTLPLSAIGLKKSSWLVQGDSVFQAGIKTKERYGPNLDSLAVGLTVGVLVDEEGCLHLYVNDIDQGIAAKDIPSTCYALVDLYGQCEQVTVVTSDSEASGPGVAQEYREKADMEDGMKESQKLGRICEPNVIKNCEYQNICGRFKAMFGLPEGYFNEEFNRCYCETCHKIRSDDPYLRKGEPPREYALPFGWCKFGLRIPPKAEIRHVFEKWHIAYHGTKASSIRKILDTGDLLVPGDVAVGGSLLGPQPCHADEKNKPEEQADCKQISLSPTVRYGGCQHFSPKYEYRDPKTKKTMCARVAFQVCVKPGSYKIGAQSIGVNEQIDPRFSNNEIEWLTKERRATVLSAMLIRIEQ